MSYDDPSGRPYGLVAEFASPTALVRATEEVYERGYRKIDAFAPYPIEALSHAVGHHHSKLPLVVLIGGVLGCLGGFGLQYWASVIEYPLNIGGRPLNSWPAFIPVTFECTILLAALSCVLGFFALCGLPMPYHPLFNHERFSAASRDRFFLAVEAEDPRFDDRVTRELLASLGATEVSEVAY